MVVTYEQELVVRLLVVLVLGSVDVILEQLPDYLLVLFVPVFQLLSLPH